MDENAFSLLLLHLGIDLTVNLFEVKERQIFFIHLLRLRVKLLLLVFEMILLPEKEFERFIIRHYLAVISDKVLFKRHRSL